MKKEDKRVMLAGNALSGLLASQPEDKGWNIDALAVVSLKIADKVLEVSNLTELPELTSDKPEEPEIEVIEDGNEQS